jgi:hypothetical protein
LRGEKSEEEEAEMALTQRLEPLLNCNNWPEDKEGKDREQGGQRHKTTFFAFRVIRGRAKLAETAVHINETVVIFGYLDLKLGILNEEGRRIITWIEAQTTK